jgi:propanol-preferring alcohol dehydrogenase
MNQPAQMLAMVCDGPGTGLRAESRAIPWPGPGEVLIEVSACGICRTDIHVLDGEVAANYPVVPGHEIVGRVAALGEGVADFRISERVGVPWLGGTCGTCSYCRSNRENLCDRPVFTGASRDGGFATHVVANAAFCFPLPDGIGDAEAAPLLCAGLIGWRAYRKAGAGEVLGLYGFGAAAHILAQIALAEGRQVVAFTRAGDERSQAFARSLGCLWAGDAQDAAPLELDAAIIFAPVGSLVPAALKAVRKGGRVVCAGIHMSDIPAFPYADLWGERQILSVANLTRADGKEFLCHSGLDAVRTHVTPVALGDANDAIERLRRGEIDGAAVLIP